MIQPAPVLDDLPTDKLRAVLDRLGSEKQRLIAENALVYYRPYPKQRAFHEAGAIYRERLLMAGNQLGKTLAGGMEAAAHATGQYPDDWKGRRFDQPTDAWVAGETAETVRDTVQRMLLGPSGAHGTGTIPKDCILDIIPSRGVPEAVDIIRVQHVTGGMSTIGIKAYADGRAKFQGTTLHWIWLDEEPPPVWDRDADVVYVTKAHRVSRETPIFHAAALRGWGKELQWAWPRDGRRETLEGAGIALADQYRKQGLQMLPDHAQFEDGSVSVEAGLMLMLDRMRAGKLKVYRHLNDWFEEFRLYHRKDGKVVKEGDDLMAATRYGLMMLRYARCTKGYGFSRPIKMPSLGFA